jgi:hypothetical protein
MRGYRIEERGLDPGASNELACECNEKQDEIAGSDGIAMALLPAERPSLCVEDEAARSRSPSAKLKIKCCIANGRARKTGIALHDPRARSPMQVGTQDLLFAQVNVALR